MWATATGAHIEVRAILANFGPNPLISVRPSPENPDWGGPGTILNVGMHAERHAILRETHGAHAADAQYLWYRHNFSTQVPRLDPRIMVPAPAAAAPRGRHLTPSRSKNTNS